MANPITLNTTYDLDAGLSTTELDLTPAQITTLAAGLNNWFIFPTGKTATNIRSLHFEQDVNGNVFMQIIIT